MALQKAMLDLGERQKQWKETPPGPEQKELERLFKAKLIKPEDTIQDVRNSNPLFKQFSSRIFSAHFRKTRAKLGIASTFHCKKQTPCI